MSTWICGCDPEAGWWCDNKNCDYRRWSRMENVKRDDIDQTLDAAMGREFNADVLPGEPFYEVKGPGAENMAEACRLVNGPRQADYGTPRENYAGVAKVFSGILCNILKRDITPEEAALMMVGLKLQRQSMKHKQDNLVDAHGYLLVYEHILNGK